MVAVVLAGALFGPAIAAGATEPPSDPPAGERDPGSIGIRLLDVPVDARDDPRAQLYIVDHLPPGAVIERRVEVLNTTSDTMAVLLYPAAAALADGAFVSAEGHAPNDVSTWSTVTPGVIDLPAGGSAVATVTVMVPADAAPGERYGVVWAETRSADGSGAGISQVSRVGIRLYLSVGPGGAPAADFDIESLTATRAADGRPTVTATVRNTGGRALDISGELELRDGPGSLHAGPFPAALGATLAIGARQPVTISLDDRLPAGPWTARITLRSGLLEHSEEMVITFPDAGAAPNVVLPGPAAAPVSVWRIVILAGGLGALVAVAARTILLRNGRRGRAKVRAAQASGRA